MSIAEIILIIAGVIIMILGYVLPAKKKETNDDIQLISEDEIRKLIDKEIEGVKEHISDVVNETVTYSMEKTERTMERVANEKIMAINEYSDTVLDEINKNHKEVLFLYDMLNDKHENLKSTVTEATRMAGEIKQTLKDAEITAKEAGETAKEVEETVKSRIDTVFDDGFVPIMPPRVEIIHGAEMDYVAPEDGEAELGETKPLKRKSGFKKEDYVPGEDEWDRFVTMNDEGSGAGSMDDELMHAQEEDENDSTRNSNDRILELHKAGKSNMTIAKELGLGIGEVKLVIDLFEGL